MGFLKTLGAWFAAGLVGYICAALASQAVVLAGLAQLGLDMSFGDASGSLVHAVFNMPALLIVILLGYAIAFGVARQVKKLLPNLSAIAYPVAGGAAIGAALGLMHMQFGVFPILGAQETYGLILQILSGAAGGAAFEALRPKTEADAETA